MEPRAKTPPPPILSLEVTATQAVELLASVSPFRLEHISEFRQFLVQPVSTPQALNHNPSVV